MGAWKFKKLGLLYTTNHKFRFPMRTISHIKNPKSSLSTPLKSHTKKTRRLKFGPNYNFTNRSISLLFRRGPISRNLNITEIGVQSVASWGCCNLFGQLNWNGFNWLVGMETNLANHTTSRIWSWSNRNTARLGYKVLVWHSSLGEKNVRWTLPLSGRSHTITKGRSLR